MKLRFIANLANTNQSCNCSQQIANLITYKLKTSKLKGLTTANNMIDELGMFLDDDPEMSNNQFFQNNTVSLNLADKLRGPCLLSPL